MNKIFDVAFHGTSPSELANYESFRNSPEAVVVSKDQPTSEVAEMVATQKPSYVLVVDSKNEICGYIDENFVKQSLLTVYKKAPESLADGLEVLANTSGLFVPDEMPGFIRPKMHFCVKGQHWTADDPCPYHD